MRGGGGWLGRRRRWVELGNVGEVEGVWARLLLLLLREEEEALPAGGEIGHWADGKMSQQ